MNLRMTSLQLAAVLLCVLHVSEAFSFSSAKCCTELGETISKTLLKTVKRYVVQKRDGVCHLQAFVLYTKDSALCVSPKNKRVKAWVKKQAKKETGKRKAEKKGTGKRKRNQRMNKKNRNKKLKKKEKYGMI